MIHNDKTRERMKKAEEEIWRIISKAKSNVPLSEDENWVYWYIKNSDSKDLDEAVSDFLYTCSMLKIF